MGRAAGLDLGLDLAQTLRLGTSSALSLVSLTAMEAMTFRELTSVFEQNVGAPLVV